MNGRWSQGFIEKSIEEWFRQMVRHAMKKKMAKPPWGRRSRSMPMLCHLPPRVFLSPLSLCLLPPRVFLLVLPLPLRVFLLALLLCLLPPRVFLFALFLPLCAGVPYVRSSCLCGCSLWCCRSVACSAGVPLGFVALLPASAYQEEAHQGGVVGGLQKGLFLTRYTLNVCNTPLK